MRYTAVPSLDVTGCLVLEIRQLASNWSRRGKRFVYTMPGGILIFRKKSGLRRRSVD
jgi:hypothetical protein